MKRTTTMVALMFLTLGLTALVCAQTPQELLQQLRDDNGDKRLEAARALGPLGAEVMEPLAEMLGGDDQRLDLCARLAIEAIVSHAAGPQGADKREAVAGALGDLAVSHKPLATRVFAVRQLGFCGGDEVLPVMWDLLMFQPDMHEIARWALLRMPGPEPVATLKRAVSEVGDPAQKVGLLNALAARASSDLYTVGAQALEDRDQGVRIAGLNLLGHVPEAAALDPIRKALTDGTDAERRAAARALVQLADTLLQAGKPSAAQAICAECAQSADSVLRAAGVAGLGHTGGPGALARLMAAAYDPDPVVRGAMAEALVVLPGTDATEAIANALGYSGPDQPPPVGLFIRVLGDRKDPAARPALVRSLTHEEPSIRAAAMRALGKIGDTSASTAQAILAALGDGEPEVVEAAEFALARLTGDEVTRVLEKRVDDPTARVREVAVTALGYHAATQPFPTQTLVRALDDEDEGVRIAAIGALQRVKDPATVTALVPLVEREGEDGKAAQRALALWRDPQATDRIVAAIGAADSPPGVRAGLIAALGAREDPAFLDTLSAAAAEADEQVAVAALDALARLGDEQAAPAFLARIEDDAPVIRAAAVRGYMGIAEAREKQDGAAALAIYRQALGMDVGEGEKATALRGIGRLANVDALPLIEPYLGDAGLKSAAAEAALPMAFKLKDAGDKERATTLCRRIVESTGDRETLRDAARCLREMGVELQLAAQRGGLVHWWVLGPFPGRERATKNDFVPVTEPIDLARKVTDGDRTLEWKYAPVDDPLGLLDFERTVARMDDCGCYAYAEVESDAEREVLMKFGSDDSVFCWLNGRQVHAWDGNRGWGEDQDTVEAHLQAGTNTVLCKVINGGANWSVSVRFTDPDGKPIVLRQRSR